MPSFAICGCISFKSPIRMHSRWRPPFLRLPRQLPVHALWHPMVRVAGQRHAAPPTTSAGLVRSRVVLINRSTAAHLPPPFFTRFLSLVLFHSFQSPGSVSKVCSRTAPVRSATDNGGVRRAAPPTTIDYFDRSSALERRALTLVFLSSFHSRSSLR